MKVFLVAGARPNFMKIAPIYRASLAVPGIDCRIVHTGQHYDYVRIPVIPDADSGASRTVVPIHSGQPFRSIRMEVGAQRRWLGYHFKKSCSCQTFLPISATASGNEGV